LHRRPCARRLTIGRFAALLAIAAVAIFLIDAETREVALA